MSSAVENGAAVDDKERRRKHRLANPHPVESQWSIPSIRLANRVDRTSSSGFTGVIEHNPNADGFADYADRSEYMDDDESFYSFLEDEDYDASLCSNAGSTIEAGPFVNRAKGAFGSRNTDVGGVTLGSNNSIALTSSGSGD